MQIQIISQSETEFAKYFDVQVGNKAIFLGYARRGTLTVCVKNASHQAWKGMGRTFGGFDEARNAYKSSEVKSAIDFVRSEVHADVS